jgi:hypothetical protein
MKKTILLTPAICLFLSGCQFSLYSRTLVETTRPAKAEVALAQVEAQIQIAQLQAAQYQTEPGQEGTNTMKAIPIPPELLIEIQKLVATWLDVAAGIRKEVTIKRVSERRFFTCDSGNGAIRDEAVDHNDIGGIKK